MAGIPLALVLAEMRTQFFLYMFARVYEESVRAEQFLYVKHALQYVNGHAERFCEIILKSNNWPMRRCCLTTISILSSGGHFV